MSNYFNKCWITIMAILLLNLISGGVLMAIELNSHQTVEIVLDSNKTPVYKLDVFIDGAVANPGYYPVKEEDTITGLLLPTDTTATSGLSYFSLQNEVPFSYKQMDQTMGTN
jgi:hypothetical protein